MTYQPVLVGGGIAGWRFLQRTYDAQLETFSNTSQRSREATNFTQKIGEISSAEELVSDRRLLRVALEAFGLQDDINNTYFVRKVLEDGSTSNDALANKLTDKRYLEFSKAFGFGPGEVRQTTQADEMQTIADKSHASGFQRAVGEQDDTLRTALFAQEELQDIAASESSDNAKWFTLMGSPPLRQMMETALGLPSGLGQVDIDKQLEIFEDKLTGLTGSGSLGQFSDPKALTKLTDTYLARSKFVGSTVSTSGGQVALTLLQGG